MPSSKKNRGKQRRRNKEAKEAASSAVNREAEAATTSPPVAVDAMSSMLSSLLLQCNHGFPTNDEGGGRRVYGDALIVFTSFVHELAECVCPFTSYLAMKEKHPRLMNNAATRSMAKAMMTSAGSKELLRLEEAKDDEEESIFWVSASFLALGTLLLEHHNPGEMVEFTSAFKFKQFNETKRDLTGLDKSATASFLAERIPCDCLDTICHVTAATETKMGHCMSCSKRMEFHKLKECSQCKYAHYCSEECQLEAWPIHKQICAKSKPEIFGTIEIID